MRGVYSLIIEITRETDIKIGSLGSIRFGKGIWLYVGSAQGKGSTNLQNRLNRHFSSDKTVHWHIDMLLESEEAHLIDALCAVTLINRECDVACTLVDDRHAVWGPSGFGASDCKRKCNSHLLKSKTSFETTKRNTSHSFKKIGLSPRLFDDLESIHM